MTGSTAAEDVIPASGPFQSLPLTWKVVLVTLLVSGVAWFFVDHYQSRQVRELFRAHMLEILSAQAQEDRLRFDRLLNEFHSTARLLAGQQAMASHMDRNGWYATPSAETTVSRVPPDWLPGGGVIRTLPRFQFALLIDARGQVRELFQNREEPAPLSLLSPSALLRGMSARDTHMTTLEGGMPVLLTAQEMTDPKGPGKVTLLLATLLDDQFLAQLSAVNYPHSLVALLGGTPRQVLAASETTRLKPGTLAHLLEGEFLLSGKAFFDYGSSDLNLQFVTLLSRDQFEALGQSILVEERRQRFFAYLALIALLALVIYWMARQIQRFTRDTVLLARERLGLTSTTPPGGDLLLVMAEQFRQMTNEILTTREALKREADERMGAMTRVFSSAMDEVSDKLQITTKLYDNVIEGMLVMDAAGNVLSVNAAYTTITGYPEHEVVGQPARLFCSDQLDDTFIQIIWDNIKQKGQWRGEIWNRRKTGEAYPEMLTIVSIQDNHGKTGNYVAVLHDLTDLKRSEAELHYKTYHDALTGLPNRSLFNDRLQQILSHAHRSRERGAVLVFDLDQFKKVNDTLGFGSGDRVLQEAAKRLRDLIREGDTECRLGSDEFAFIIRELSDVQDAAHVVRKLRDVLSLPFATGEHFLNITASIGITMYPDDGLEPSNLLQNADIAMARAKKAGGNTYKFYTPTMGEQAARSLLVEGSLTSALENDEFVLFYQPKVDVQSNRITGMEALIRWRKSDGTMVSPGEFIPVAEESGFIVPLGEWVLRTACRQTRLWLDAGLGPLRTAVNLSPRQFQHKGLLRMVEEILSETGLPPHLLELEITEGMMMSDVNRAASLLYRIQEMGVRLSVDDFGTGYSSLSYLKGFPLSTLKIDRSFVQDISCNSDDKAIVTAIISLAHNLNLLVVAEGVETPDQLDFLRTQQCDEYQGFLFAKPLPPEQFQALLVGQGATLARPATL